MGMFFYIANSNLDNIIFGTATLQYVTGGQYLRAIIDLPESIKKAPSYASIFSVVESHADYSKVYSDKSEANIIKFISVRGKNNYTSDDYIYINYVLATI